jgi:hypothetical protein
MTTQTLSPYARWRAAIDFMEAKGFPPAAVHQISSHGWGADDVDRALAAGFKPYRYSHEGHPPDSGVLRLVLDGIELYAGCDGVLLDYAEMRAAK